MTFATTIVEFLAYPAFWIVVAATSELIALSPLKSNSIIQLVFQVLNLLKAKKGLISFGKPAWERRLEQAIRQWWFEKTLPAKLDAAEAEWQKAQPLPQPPLLIEHPVNDELQTGASRLLGGEISIHALYDR